LRIYRCDACDNCRHFGRKLFELETKKERNVINTPLCFNMKALSFIAFLLSLIASGDAAVGQCEGPCVFNETMTCAVMIETMEFGGSCCSLADDPVTGNCVITISGGSCYWVERCTSGCECDGFGGASCVVPYTLWSAGSNAPCPTSTYNVSGTECTTPFDPAVECAVPNANITENESMEPTPAIPESESMEPTPVIPESESMEPTPAIQESESMGPTAAIPENESMGPTTTGIPENESMGPTAAPGTSAGVHTFRGVEFAIMSTLFIMFASSSINHRHV
jgi:hypothetical protein